MSHTIASRISFTRALTDQRIKGEGLTDPGFIFLVIVIIATVMITILFYIWSRLEIVKLGYGISEKNKKQIELLEENRLLRLEFANLKSPERIEGIARERLGLLYPGEGQIIVIK